MKTHLIASMLVLSIAAAACAVDRESTPIADYPASGVVTAGPVCPVVQNPPDPACDDRPVAGAVLVILDATGRQFTEIVADSAGRFDVMLPAGRYTLEPQPMEGFLGTAPAQEFEAGPGLTVELIVGYDTGIR